MSGCWKVKKINALGFDIMGSSINDITLKIMLSGGFYKEKKKVKKIFI